MAFADLQPSVCIDAVMGDQDIDSALSLVSQCGIPAFEFWAWWEKDVDEIIATRDRYGLTIVACCTRFISLVDPAARNEYLDGLKQSLGAANKMDCKILISQVGDSRPHVSRDDQHQSLIDGLKQAAPMLERANVTLVIEPLNEKVDHPGYYLTRSDEAFAIVGEVGSDNVKVVFDIYHQQISEGDLIQNITANIDQIGHFHAAGNPGRHELTVGEIAYRNIFDAIANTGYRGHVGLEYWPIQNPSVGLHEVARWFE